MDTKSLRHRSFLRYLLAAIAVVAFTAVTASAARFGTMCQENYQNGWQHTLPYVWERCAYFNNELDDTDTKVFYYSLVGAKPNEVICMNSLTVNLHLMMATFYHPTKSRFKILMEDPAFPSDTYAIKTQIVHHGLNPKDSLLLASPRQGEFIVQLTVPDLIGEHHQIVVEVTLEGRQLRPSEAATLVSSRLVETLFLALMGTTIAVIFAVPLSFLGAKNLMTRNPAGTAIYYVVRTVFNITRSVEPLIMATVFAVWVGIGPFAGVLALALHSVASLGKLYSEQIESIDPGPIEAITATGASPLQVVRYAVVPQIIPPFIAFTVYRWDINVRMSTVIGMVGGGGVGFLLIQYINQLLWREAATAVWGITVVVAAMDYASAWIRERVV